MTSKALHAPWRGFLQVVVVDGYVEEMYAPVLLGLCAWTGVF